MASLETLEPPPIAQRIWQAKYRRIALDGRLDASPADSFRRVAKALAAVETTGRDLWERRFFEAMNSLRFLPGGRVLAGAGARGEATLFNCFVLPPPRNDRASIRRTLEQALRTQALGGGVGFDLSLLPPEGYPAGSRSAVHPVGFMNQVEEQCPAHPTTDGRRAAMMGTLSCSHPDIGRFISAKSEAGVLAHFNLSVQVSDAFMAAEAADTLWPLQFAELEGAPVSARQLWRKLLEAAFETAEPGVLFIDRINALNNLWYRERLTTTNPCGEAPLPPFGACVLGSLNLARFVLAPFTHRSRIDASELVHTTRTAVRMLDDVIDVSTFPLPEQRIETLATRRIGLGVMGLADAFVMLGIRYDSAEAREWLASVLRLVRDSAYQASVDLAKERGAFPAFRRDDFLAGGFAAKLDHGISDAIARHGIRNSHLLAIAPTGSISLLAGAVSSGIEPPFSAEYVRPVPGSSSSETIEVINRSVHLWRLRSGSAALPPAFVDASQVAGHDQIAIQAVAQAYVDGAISKTVQLAADADFDGFRTLFREAHALGLKGCTVFRPGTPRGSFLARVPSCCPQTAETEGGGIGKIPDRLA